MFTLTEIIIISLVVCSAVIILVIAAVTVIAVAYYQLKILRKQRERLRELQRHQRREAATKEVIVVPEENYSEATTYTGEAPPRYHDAITSSDYQSISIENLNQINMEDKDGRQNDAEKSLELLPPSYTYMYSSRQ